MIGWRTALVFTLAIAACPVAALAEGDDHGDQAAEEAHDAAAGEAHGIDAVNWIDFGDPHTPPLVPMFVNFALLLVVVYFILRGPIGGGAKERRVRLEQEIEAARVVKEEAEKALKEARAKVEALDQEMAKLRKEILDGGQAEAARITEEASRRAERLQADTAALVEQEVARMSQAIREEVVSGVVDRAEAIIREKIRDDDQARLAREYLQSMSETSVDKPGG
jgi:F0F1-type ATP synthase membrane subunit b/b'